MRLQLGLAKLEVTSRKGSIGLGPYGFSYCLIEDFLAKDKRLRYSPISYFGLPIWKWLFRRHTPYFSCFSWTYSRQDWSVRFWGHGIRVLRLRKIEELAWSDERTKWESGLQFNRPGRTGRWLDAGVRLAERLLKFTHRRGRVPAIKFRHYIVKAVAPFRY